MEYFLRQIERGNSNPLHIDLLTNEVVVGRSTNVELTKYGQVSRKHATFFKKVENGSEQWYVNDLKSMNGIYVNGFRIAPGQEHRIDIGDHIGFGIPNTEVEGFVCTLSARKRVNRPIEVIDLSLDDPPIIKMEPKDDVGPNHVESASPPVNSTATGLFAKKTSDKSVINCGASHSRSYIECSNSVPPSDQDKYNVNPTVQNLGHNGFASTSAINSNSGTLSRSNSTYSNLGINNQSVVKPSELLTNDVAINSTRPAMPFKPNNFIGNVWTREDNVPSAEQNFDLQISDRTSTNLMSIFDPEHLSKKSEIAPVSKSYLVKQSSFFKAISGVDEEICDIPLKKCCISLTRCDSINFKWPLDVKPPSNSISNSGNDHVQRNIELNQKTAQRSNSFNSSMSEMESRLSVNRSVPGSSSSIMLQLPFSKKASFFNMEDIPKSTLEDNGKFKGKKPFVTSSNNTNLENSCKPIIEIRPQNPTDYKMNTRLDSVGTKPFCSSLKNESSEPAITENLINRADMETISDDDENNFGYSQKEEVIIISDDESYFDFNTSQVLIKEEPLDEDLEHEIFGKSYDEEYTANHSAAIDDRGNVSSSINDSFSDGISESVDNIKKFIGSTCSTSDQKRDSDPHFDENLAKDIGDYFPMSQINTYDEDSDDISKAVEACVPPQNDDSDSSAESLNYSVEPSRKEATESKMMQSNGRKRTSKIKSTGKVILTLPERMERRPKRMRGREEWFEEKQMPSPVKPSPVKPSRNKIHSQKAKKINSSNPKTLSKNKTGKPPFRKMIEQEKNMFASYKIPRKPKTHQSPRKEQPRSDSKKSVQGNHVERKSPAVKNKTPVITRKPGRSSRSDHLLNDMQTENPRKTASKNEAVSSKNYHKSVPCLDKSTINNTSSPALTSTFSPAIKTPLLAGTSMSASNFREPLAVAGPSGINLSDKPTGTSQFKFSDSKVCPVFPSRINTDPRLNNKDPRTNRSASASNNRMLKYPNSKPAAAHCEPSVSQYSSHNKPSNPAFSSISMQKSNKPVAIINRHPIITEIKDSFCKSANFIEMIKRIVELKVLWLEEQKAHNNPPKQVSIGANNLPIFFKSLDQYISSFYPMLMLEVWETMYAESKIIFEGNRTPNKFYFVIVECGSYKHVTEYKCESVVNKLSFLPMEGNLVILDVVNKKDKIAGPMFGYINWHKVEEFRKNTMKPKWDKLDKMWLEDAKLWTFKVWVKNRGDNFIPEFDSLRKGNGICYIKNKVRLVDNFQKLQKSPLCEGILTPNEKIFYVNYPAVSPGQGFSHSQKTAIEGMSRELKNQCSEPKIILLQGPPGTGKTHTIIGLLEKLLFVQGPRLKILVTAPSNAAVDEIGCRLKSLNKRLKPHLQPIKFVRVGLPSQIHPDMKPFTLDEKANQMKQECLLKKTKYNEEQLQKKQNEINILKKQKPDYKTQQKMSRLEKDFQVMKQQFSLQKSDYGTQRNYKIGILQESDIVLSTLGSCNQAILASVFQTFSNASFHCCIIDEATQCTEVETLQVLNFGIRKIVLVGDHQQLPATVNSKLAIKYGFERSMFERFYFYFSRYFQHSPIFMLTEQFRMHSEICRFPSKKFYNNQLVTSPTTDIQYQRFPIQPYIFYDILVSQEFNSSSSKTNQNEALAIVNLCTELLNLNIKASIGIITPYQAQRSLYSTAFNHNPLYRNIEVNTVDGFQGRERDVIIVSCVRANSSKGGIGFLSCKKRLNVAITRAKKCLIICAHSNTLMQDSNWRDLIEDARERQLCKPVTGDKDIHLVLKRPYMKTR